MAEFEFMGHYDTKIQGMVKQTKKNVFRKKDFEICRKWWELSKSRK